MNLDGTTAQYEKSLHERKSSGRSVSPYSEDSGLSNNSNNLTSNSGSTGSLSGKRVGSQRSLLAGIGKLVAAEDFGEKLVYVKSLYQLGSKEDLVVLNVIC